MAILRILLLILLLPFILLLRLFGIKGREDMVYLPDDHEDMKKAIAEARAALPDFHAALTNPPPNTRDFAVKVRFPVEGGHEHCWVGDLAIAGEGYQGKIGNIPQGMSRKLGDSVEIAPEQITDWAYFKDDVAQGHFTTRALLPHMSKKMKAKVLAVFGWNPAGIPGPTGGVEPC